MSAFPGVWTSFYPYRTGAAENLQRLTGKQSKWVSGHLWCEGELSAWLLRLSLCSARRKWRSWQAQLRSAILCNWLGWPSPCHSHLKSFQHWNTSRLFTEFTKLQYDIDHNVVSHAMTLQSDTKTTGISLILGFSKSRAAFLQCFRLLDPHATKSERELGFAGSGVFFVTWQCQHVLELLAYDDSIIHEHYFAKSDFWKPLLLLTLSWSCYNMLCILVISATLHQFSSTHLASVCVRVSPRVCR